ncbi:MAG: phage antirepressor N-terminal domain-containing protein [Leptospirales bacterium]
MNTSLLPVPFHGTTLFLLEQNNEPYTPMKPIVEGMGLGWSGQHEKLNLNKDRWGIRVNRIPSENGAQETLCMPLRKLPGWLMTIHPTRVKPEIREKIIQYQNECDDVLWKYWTEGHVTNPRIETISPAQQHEIQVIVARRAQDSGKLRAEIWSRFDNHFRIARYSQLPASKFEEAKAYIETLHLRGPETSSFRIESVTVYGLPTLPEEDRTFSRKYGEAVLSALRAWSREACAEPVRQEVSRGLDALERVLTRAATEMDEAALHLALAGKYLKRWRAGETGGPARELPSKKTPYREEKRGTTYGDPLVGVDLPLSTWKTIFRRLGLDPEMSSGDIERRLMELI